MRWRQEVPITLFKYCDMCRFESNQLGQRAAAGGGNENSSSKQTSSSYRLIRTPAGACGPTATGRRRIGGRKRGGRLGGPSAKRQPYEKPMDDQQPDHEQKELLCPDFLVRPCSCAEEINPTATDGTDKSWRGSFSVGQCRSPHWNPVFWVAERRTTTDQPATKRWDERPIVSSAEA